MAKYNPYKSSFDQAKSFEKYSQYILWLSTIILAIAFTVKVYDKNLLYISEFLNSLNCFFIISYPVLTFISEYFFYDASNQKRVDFIDNSFDSSYSDDHSIEYYTNENIANGIYKMAVNSFENSFFTYHIASEMTKNKWLKNLLFAVLILTFAIFGFNNAFILLVQLTLPILLFQEALNHTLFVYRINRVLKNFRRLFNDLKETNDIKSKRPEILLNVLEYETILSSGGILLDSKVYQEMNPELSKKWEQLKKDYEINNNH